VARLGFLGPVIVLVGAAVAGVGTLYAVHARPKAGAVIDTLQLGSGGTLVVREEDGGERSFVELRANDEVQWQAFIPHYAGGPGRPAIAWGPTAVTVRVERSGRAEVFALSMRDSTKLGGFRLAPEREPITTQPTGPITLTDHVRSYELVGGADWHELVAVDLRSGNALWKAVLGKSPITDGGVVGADVWVVQDGRKRHFNVFTGREDKSLN
jgi:hypothetical protein